MRRIDAAAVALLCLPLLAACGNDTPAASDDTAAPTDSPADPTDATTPEGTGDPILDALEALSPDVFETGESCVTPGEPPVVNDDTSTRSLSAPAWFGGPDADTGSVKPTQVFSADLCVPPEGDTKVRMESDILVFDSADDASAWVDELAAATADGQPVIEDVPSPCTEVTPHIATAAPESIGGPDAVDVVVTNARCGADKDFPDQLSWEPPTHTVAAGGSYVVSVYVHQDTGYIDVSNAQMTMKGVTQTIAVDRERQEGAVQVLTERLGED